MSKKYEREFELIGTHILVQVVSAQSEEEINSDLNLVYQECLRIEQKYSRFISESELSKLNKKIGEWIKVDAEFYELLKIGNNLKNISGGYFDLTVKSILDSLGYDSNYSFEIKGKLGATGEILLKDDLQVQITAEVDLGGLGKGYVLDQIVEVLNNYDNFCINAGGDIYARGNDLDNKKWKILFEHPADSHIAIGFVEIDNFFITASSPSRRSWGKFHHLIDPKIKSSASRMLATFVQADSGLIADSYSTFLFAMGFEQAKSFLENERRVEAILISPMGIIFKTAGFKGELYLK